MSGTLSYTVEEANSLVPWLRDSLRSLREAQENVQISVLVMQRLAAHKRKSHAAVVDYDIQMAERAIARGRDRMRDIVMEMTAKGVELRDLAYGLVDIPSVRDGEVVWLCWRLEEPEIAHWHEIGSGFASRRPI